MPSVEPTIVDATPRGEPTLAPRRMGRYEVLEELGRGGMGAVFSAYDPELDRKVALKVLAGDDGERHRARLLREAQALARLAHPNVVAVHDVGVLDGQVYVAMEHIQGQSLRRWLETRRRWREIVDMFVQAGRGLAVAHSVGLVHRDFKPDNVMVSVDGRARVLDFGLAALAGGGGEPTEPAGPALAPPGSRPLAEAATEVSTDVRGATLTGGSLLSSRLTVAGTRMGTLAYMSPEQFAASELGPASDQFSFGVALYEALYRQRPFAGDTAAEYAVAVSIGAVRPPPRGSDVPRWLLRVVQRALAVDPRARFPDMPTLLGELARDRARTRRLLAAGGVALVAGAVAAGALAARAPAAEPCSGAATHLEGVWDASRRDEVAAAFASTGLAYARDSAERVASRLDEHARVWVAAHADTCRAHLRGELSDSLFDRQMECLKGQVRGVAALVAVFARADASAVQRAIDAIDVLPPPAHCADPDRLFPEHLVPADPEVAAAVVALREQLAAGEAEYAAGHYSAAAERADAVEAAARGLGDAALRAEALYYSGFAHEQLGDYVAARSRWLDGYWTAVETHHREYELSLALALFGHATDENMDVKEGALWRGTSRALVRRQHAERSEDQITLLGIMAEQALLEQSREEAARLALAAVAMSIELFGADGLRTGHARGTAGRILRNNGKLDDSLREYSAARDILLARLGPNHPGLAPAINNLAAVLMSLGRFAEAEVQYLAALRLLETSIGLDSTPVGYIYSNLSDLYSQMGRFEEGVAAAQQALARVEREFGPDHPRTALVLNNLGSTLIFGRRAAEALPHLLRSLALYEKSFGPDHFEVAFPVHGLAEAYLATARPELAEPYFRRSLALTAKALGPDHPENALDHLGIGLVLLARGRPHEALPSLERAKALCSGSPNGPKRLPEVRFAIARALWDIGRDRGQARREAEEALAALRDVPSIVRTRPEEIEAWLAAHPAPRAKR